jgi:hypothetical protein
VESYSHERRERERDFICGGKSIILLKGSQASPSRPADRAVRSSGFKQDPAEF